MSDDPAPQAGIETTEAPVLSHMLAAIRAVQMYPEDNQALEEAVDRSFTSLAEILEEAGGATVWMAGEFLYVNDRRVRLSLSSNASLTALKRHLRDHGVGRFEVEVEVGRPEWRGWLDALASEPSAGQPPLHAMRQALEEAGVTRVTVGPPSPLFRGEIEEEDERQAARRAYAESVRTAHDVFERIGQDRAVPTRKAQRSVLQIVDRVLEDPATMLCMTTLRDYDERLYVHSVHVTILAVALGEAIGMGREQLFALGMAALFHDVGKLTIPREVLDKPGMLTNAQWSMMTRHPADGMLLLADAEIGGERPYRAMLAAYEHHLQVDLSGYPQTVRVDGQGLFARIIALCETYDAALLGGHGGSEAPTPFEVLAEVRGAAGQAFDESLVRAFVGMMGVYPVGTIVALDTGELGVVIAPSTDPDHPERPLVRLCSDTEGRHRQDAPRSDLLERGADGHFVRSVRRTLSPETIELSPADFAA